MKKIILLITVFTTYYFNSQAQTMGTFNDIERNSAWLKLGINIGAPVSTVSNTNSVVAGVDVKAQLLESNYWGVGLTAGYNHFFAKHNYKSFGTVPVGGFVRYYPDNKGIFGRVDGGYSFVTGNAVGATGGAFVKPQIGYHVYDWNFYTFYDNVFRADSKGGNIQSVGVGVTYNIRFKSRSNESIAKSRVVRCGLITTLVESMSRKKRSFI